MDAEVHEFEPEGFNAKVHVASCYLEVESKVLLMKHSPSKGEPGKWGVPAGKFEMGESAEEAAVRELFEETGISLDALQRVGTLYIRKPDVDYVYHMFKVRLGAIPEVRLSDEHEEYRWVAEGEIEELPLMAGAKQALHFFRRSHLPDTSP
ncbi:MAG: NUDIX hydrolase [Chlamydiota bacterium]